MLMFEFDQKEAEILKQLLQLSEDHPMFFDVFMQNKEQYGKCLPTSITEVLDELEKVKQTDQKIFEDTLHGYTTYFSFDDKEKKESYYCYQVLKDDPKWFDRVLKKYQSGKATKVEQYVLKYLFHVPQEEKKQEVTAKRSYASLDDVMNTIFDIQLGRFARENFDIQENMSEEVQKKILLSYALYSMEHFEEEKMQTQEILLECMKHLSNHTIDQFEAKWVEPNVIDLSVQDADQVFSYEDSDPPTLTK